MSQLNYDMTGTFQLRDGVVVVPHVRKNRKKIDTTGWSWFELNYKQILEINSKVPGTFSPNTRTCTVRRVYLENGKLPAGFVPLETSTKVEVSLNNNKVQRSAPSKWGASAPNKEPVIPTKSIKPDASKLAEKAKEELAKQVSTSAKEVPLDYNSKAPEVRAAQEKVESKTVSGLKAELREHLVSIVRISAQLSVAKTRGSMEDTIDSTFTSELGERLQAAAAEGFGKFLGKISSLLYLQS